MMPNLTLGLDLSDTPSRYCALNAGGQIVATGRVRTTPAGLEREVARWPGSRMVLEVGTLGSLTLPKTPATPRG